MIVRGTSNYIPQHTGIESVTENVAAIHEQRSQSMRCIFKVGEPVKVRDYQDDKYNYPAVVTCIRRNFFGDCECRVRTPEGREFWRGTASLRKDKAARKAT